MKYLLYIGSAVIAVIPAYFIGWMIVFMSMMIMFSYSGTYPGTPEFFKFSINPDFLIGAGFLGTAFWVFLTLTLYDYFKGSQNSQEA